LSASALTTAVFFWPENVRARSMQPVRDFLCPDEVLTMPTPAGSAADLDLLRRYDTPTVCNVIELFDLHRRTYGYMDRRIQSCYPKLPPMVGFATTATFRSADSPRAGGAYSGLAEQIEAFAKC